MEPVFLMILNICSGNILLQSHTVHYICRNMSFNKLHTGAKGASTWLKLSIAFVTTLFLFVTIMPNAIQLAEEEVITIVLEEEEDGHSKTKLKPQPFISSSSEFLIASNKLLHSHTGNEFAQSTLWIDVITPPPELL